MPSQITAPSGVQLQPTPPKPMRVSKRAMMAIGFVLSILAVVVCYGAYKRSNDQARTNVAAAEHNTPSSALPAAKRLKDESISRDTNSGAKGTPSERGRQIPGSAASDLIPPPLENDAGIHNPPALPASGAGLQTSGSSSHEMTAEEKRRQLAYQREQEARNAPTTVQTSPGAGAAGRTATTSPTADLLATALGQRPGAANPKALQDAISNALRPPSANPDSTTSQDQSEKETFLQKARSRRPENYLNSTRVPSLSNYEIKAGWDIPAVLEQALDSDLPGEIRAMVRSNVYDSATGRYLLIPQGARLVGTYNSNVSYGQSGLQVVWSRLIFPDGSSITLDGMIGQDEQGKSGFRYDVDHHYKRLFGTALLTSLFSAGLQLSQNTGQQSVAVTPTPGQVAGQAVGQQVTQLGIDITRKNLQVAPTIKIPIGYRFNVRVNRDMLLDRPYLPDRQDPIFQTSNQ